MDEKKKISVLKLLKKTPKTIKIILTTVVVTLAVVFYFNLANNEEPLIEIVGESAIDRIVDVSELSTFQSVYNGVATVMNETDIEDVDYYVSYSSVVKAGIDFNEVVMEANHEQKILKVILPKVYITDVNVDIESLDFMIYSSKLNTETLTSVAYSICIEDAKREVENESAILSLATQNAENVILALLNPFISGEYADYTVLVEIQEV